MSYDVAAEPTGVQWRQCSYFRHLRAQWMRPGSSSVKINLHYDALATEPTGVQWRQCSYFRRLRAQWMRPGSSSVEINVHYDALATEPTGVQWRQCSYFRCLRAQWMCRDQPTIRCSYFSRRMGPVDATRFKRLDQPPERVVDLHRVRCSCFRRLVAEPSVVEV